MTHGWQIHVASSVSRDGLGVELIEGEDNLMAEVFRHDADHTVSISIFGCLPFQAVEWLIEVARDKLGSFDDGTPLPPRLQAHQVARGTE